MKNAAELFFVFLAPELQNHKPKIQVAWRDETPDVVEFARGGAPLRGTEGNTPLVSTTVVPKASPESLREMRAKLAEEKALRESAFAPRANYDGNDAERF